MCCYNSFRMYWLKRWTLTVIKNFMKSVQKTHNMSGLWCWLGRVKPTGSQLITLHLMRNHFIFRAVKILYLCFSLWMWHVPFMLAPTELPLQNWWEKLYVNFVLYQGRLIKVMFKYFAMINLIPHFTKNVFIIYHFLPACMTMCQKRVPNRGTRIHYRVLWAAMW